MPKTIVISQPMFFPWVGIFEQVRLADEFIHYDDVQFSKGSFFNRVQIKTPTGIKWLTVPLQKVARETAINQMRCNNAEDWRRSHLDQLKSAYKTAPHQKTMLELVEEVYAYQDDLLSDLSIRTIETLSAFLGLSDHTTFLKSSALNIDGHSTQRVMEIVLARQGEVYVTGHGARHYFNHDLLERHGIHTQYVDYQLQPYPQRHGPFTPFVSILDAIANLGTNAADLICSQGLGWKAFLTRAGLPILPFDDKSFTQQRMIQDDDSQESRAA